MRLALALAEAAPAGRAWDRDAAALFAAMTTPPTAGRMALINTLIAALKASGVWAKLDVLHVMAAETSQAALLNWRSPGTFDASLVNAPSFTADRGFTGDGATSYVNSGFNPATAGGLYAQDSASFGIWSRTSGQQSNAGAGWHDGTDGVTITPRNASDQFVFRMNSTAVYTVVASVTNGSGFFAANRSGSGSTNTAGYVSGVQQSISGGSASAALNSAELNYGHATASTYSAVQFAAGVIGRSMNEAEHAALHSTLSNYMTAVGVA